MPARFSIKKLIFALLAGGVGLIAAFLLLVGKPAPQPRPADAPPPTLVSIVVATPTTVALPVETQGTVEPRRRINLVAQVGGKVSDVSNQFSAGSFIQKGEVLLKIEQDDYHFAIARAQSQVAAAQQRVAEERGRNLQAKREWRDLGSVDANALFLREPQLRAAQAALAAAQADLDAARLALKRTAITAPFDGRIESKRADLGQFLAAGTIVADIHATDVMEVRLPLTDSQLALLDLPLRDDDDIETRSVVISSRFAGQIWQWQGLIKRIQASVDRDSRVVYAIAEITEPYALVESGRPPLVPGMFVAADIPSRAIAGVTELPAAALRSDNTVLVVGDQQRLQRYEVDIKLRRSDTVWVVGLDEGMQVVASHSNALAAGSLVAIMSNVAHGQQ